MMKVYNELIELDPDFMELNNKLTNGLYLRFDVNKTMAENLADLEGNRLVVDKKFYSDGLDFDNRLHDWILERDVLSRFVTINKALSWKIHTSNMFSFSLKEASFYKEDTETKVVNELPIGELETFLLGYYARIGEVPDKYIKLFGIGETKLSNDDLIERFKQAEPDLSEYVYGEERAELFGKIYKLMIDGSDELETFLRDSYGELGNTDYIKIFFDAPVDYYENEKALYVAPLRFAKKDSIKLNNQGLISGIPLDDFVGANKKYYRRPRASTLDFSDLNTVDEEEARQELFKWIKGDLFSGGNILSLALSSDFNRMSHDYQRILLNVGVEQKKKIILGYDNISFDRPNEVSIDFINYLDGGFVFSKETTIEGAIQRMMITYLNLHLSEWDIRKISTKELDYKGMVSGDMISYFMGIRNDLFNWYHTGNEKGIASKFDQFSLNVIRSFMTHCLGRLDGKSKDYNRDTYSHLIEMLNVRWSLLKYFDVGYSKKVGDEILVMLKWFKELRESNSEEVVIETDEQFYFVAGQLFKYLNTRSKSAREGAHYLKKSTGCTSIEAVKDELFRLLNLYGHAVFANYRFFNRSVASVMSYSGSKKYDKSARDMLMSGLYADNVFMLNVAKDVLEDEIIDEKGEI